MPLYSDVFGHSAHRRVNNVRDAVFQTLLVFSLFKFKPTMYGSYEFPLMAELVGVGLTLASVICIPLGALHEVLKTDSSLTIIQVRKRVTCQWSV